MDPVVETVFFDLDGTLYPIENGYEAHIRNRLLDFMHIRLGVPRQDAHAVWWKHFQIHNQSLKGLRAAGYQFDTEDYLDYIRHGHEDFLQPDPEVRALISALPQENKWVFTNCNEKHALLALETLGLQGLFKGVIGADAMGDVCKPDPAAFAIALRVSGADASRSVIFEDSLKNLRTAKALGLSTLLIESKTAEEEGGTSEDVEKAVDGVVKVLSLDHVKAVFPHIWGPNSNGALPA